MFNLINDMLDKYLNQIDKWTSGKKEINKLNSLVYNQSHRSHFYTFSKMSDL